MDFPILSFLFLFLTILIVSRPGPELHYWHHWVDVQGILGVGVGFRNGKAAGLALPRLWPEISLVFGFIFLAYVSVAYGGLACLLEEK